MFVPGVWLVVALCAAAPTVYREADPPIDQWKRDCNAPLLERILARISDAPEMLADPRLDWDVWRAFLQYENAVAHKDEYNTYRDHGTLQLLHRTKWLDDKQYEQLQARGFHKLPTTLDSSAGGR